MRQKYTNEVQNLAFASLSAQQPNDRLVSQVSGPFWEVLASCGKTLMVSREYEHFVLALGNHDDMPIMSVLDLPHPSGISTSPATGDLIVSSTRTPNQIFWLKQLTSVDFEREIVPVDIASSPPLGMLVPYRSVILPGSLYIHDILEHNEQLYATATGHNCLIEINQLGGWKKTWWPGVIDSLGTEAFRENNLQLNSIGIGESLEDSYFTAFSNTIESAKPWKAGYGPKGKGVIYSFQTREPLVTGLTCPHAAKVVDGKLWFCNSGYGEVSVVDLNGNSTPDVVSKLAGFTRGLAFAGDYAPGLNPKDTQCGVVVLNAHTGEQVAQIVWPNGDQIYDLQFLDVPFAYFPGKNSDDTELNPWLRYLG